MTNTTMTMTDQQWKQAYQEMGKKEFGALLSRHGAHIDAEEERSGKCIDCGASISVERRYIIIPKPYVFGAARENQVVALGRFRDPCQCG